MGFEPPGYCPNCGEYVETGAASCEACGSCPETGWNDDTTYDGLDLPGEEQATGSNRARGGFQKWILGAIFVVLLVYVYVLR